MDRCYFFLLNRGPPSTTRLTHSSPTLRASDLPPGDAQSGKRVAQGARRTRCDPRRPARGAADQWQASPELKRFEHKEKAAVNPRPFFFVTRTKGSSVSPTAPEAACRWTTARRTEIGRASGRGRVGQDG